MRSTPALSRYLLVPMLSIALGCGGGSSDPTSSRSSPPPPGTPNSVVVTNNTFTPGDLTVAMGATVTWTWNTCTSSGGYGGGETCVDHNVTFGQGTNSGTKSKGTFARLFPTVGSYSYQCSIHGPLMSGRIIVQ